MDIINGSNNTFHILSEINSKLFTAEVRRLIGVIRELHKSNQQVLGKRLDGFMYMGKFYSPPESAKGKGERITLALDLWPQMQDYLDDQKVIDEDMALIRQTLFRQLDNCFNGQDIRDAIPECIVDTLPEMYQKLERHRDPLFFLNNLSDIKQYNKALPRMEFYSACRLLY